MFKAGIGPQAIITWTSTSWTTPASLRHDSRTWDDTILRSTSFSTCHECDSQCSLQNTLAELSHSDHLGTLSKDCSRELQATGSSERMIFSYRVLGWDGCMPWFQANTHLPLSSYIYLSTCQSIAIYPYLSLHVNPLMRADWAGVCIMGYTFQRVSMCSWVIWGGL